MLLRLLSMVLVRQMVSFWSLPAEENLVKRKSLITVTSRCRKWQTTSIWFPIMLIIWNCIMKGSLIATSPRSSAKRKSTNGGLLVTVIQSNIRILTGRTLYFRLDGCRTIQSISTEDLTKFTIIYPVITWTIPVLWKIPGMNVIVPVSIWTRKSKIGLLLVLMLTVRVEKRS